jgi:hypothetical protein
MIKPPEFIAAVALMDQHFPGWRERVNPDILDLGSLDLCVIGQLFQPYSTGTWTFTMERIFKLDYAHPSRYCFSGTRYLPLWKAELQQES